MAQLSFKLAGFCFCSLLLFLTSTSVLATDEQSNGSTESQYFWQDIRWDVSVGYGLVSKTNPYTSTKPLEHYHDLFANVSLDYHDFYLDLNHGDLLNIFSGGYHLDEINDWSIDFIFGNYNYYFYLEPSDSIYPKPLYSMVEKREVDFSMGFRLAKDFGGIYFSSDLVADLNEAKDAYLLRNVLTSDYTLGNADVRAGLVVDVMSEGITQYYFGIREKERKYFGSYEPGMGIAGYLLGSIEYPISESVVATGSVLYGQVNSEIYNSPIIGVQERFTMFMGLRYVF